tara:strand:- start:750 stop:1469 length:720 start_codon:yes stop_codon:yes gene_type:complete
MDDTMKEEKLGGKKHGMVVVISLGKPGDKKPERAADPDTKKKASIEELQQEADSLSGRGGDPETARRFQTTAKLLSQETPGRELATQAANIIFPEDEKLPDAIYEEGLQNPDFMDMRLYPQDYDPDFRESYMRLMRQMEKHRRKVQQGQESLAQLRADDPSKFFFDREHGLVQTGEAMDMAFQLLKAICGRCGAEVSCEEDELSDFSWVQEGVRRGSICSECGSFLNEHGDCMSCELGK